MKITIINHTTLGRLQNKNEKNEKKYTREELDDFVAQLREGTFRQKYVRDYNKEVCFAAEWQKVNGELKSKAINPLVLLSLENLRDLATVEAYKRLATMQPYTLLCFIGHDGHSLHIVCRYSGLLLNAYRKLHYIYSSQLGTPLSEQEPTLETSCKVSYDQLYAQLYAELQQGRRYWFEDEENQRIIQQNADFQQVNDYEKMILLTYLPPEDTDIEEKFILVQDIMKRLAILFPTFVIGKNTYKDIGKTLVSMGYEYRKRNKGAAYRIKEI